MLRRCGGNSIHICMTRPISVGAVGDVLGRRSLDLVVFLARGEVAAAPRGVGHLAGRRHVASLLERGTVELRVGRCRGQAVRSPRRIHVGGTPNWWRRRFRRPGPHPDMRNRKAQAQPAAASIARIVIAAVIASDPVFPRHGIPRNMAFAGRKGAAQQLRSSAPALEAVILARRRATTEQCACQTSKTRSSTSTRRWNASSAVLARCSSRRLQRLPVSWTRCRPVKYTDDRTAAQRIGATLQASRSLALMIPGWRCRRSPADPRTKAAYWRVVKANGELINKCPRRDRGTCRALAQGRVHRRRQG